MPKLPWVVLSSSQHEEESATVAMNGTKCQHERRKLEQNVCFLLVLQDDGLIMDWIRCSTLPGVHL
eukprot:1160710-Pelagomonas_calceolata.AAC.2